MSRLLIVGIGDYKISNNGDDIIKTYALGSCVATIILDPKIRAGIMGHIALPESKINPERGETQPCYFADTGIARLLLELKRMGSVPHRGYIVKLIGGANVIDTGQGDHFDIGRRNITAIKKQLWASNIVPTAEDVGKNHSRTVSLSMADGRLTISSADGTKWSL